MRIARLLLFAVSASCGASSPRVAGPVRPARWDACERGDARVCVEAGRSSAPQDPPLALHYFVVGCDLMSLESCREAISLMASGVVVTDEEQGKAILLHAVDVFGADCMKGQADSCFVVLDEFADLLSERRRAFSEKWADILNFQCSDGDMQSCRVLAFAYLEGSFVTRDAEMAVQYLVKACDGGSWGACRIAAGILDPSDPVRSRGLYDRALAGFEHQCDAEGLHCDTVAEIYERGEGRPADPRLAAAFRQRAVLNDYGRCERGRREACHRLVRCLETSCKAIKDLAVERALILRTACAQGVKKACNLP